MRGCSMILNAAAALAVPGMEPDAFSKYSLNILMDVKPEERLRARTGNYTGRCLACVTDRSSGCRSRHRRMARHMPTRLSNRLSIMPSNSKTPERISGEI
jgi:hypothetical protein